MQKQHLDASLYWLKVSRPGLWFQTIWLYLVPTSQNLEIFAQSIFWVGFFYITFPLNLMTYGVNDYFDVENDRHNIRKDSFLWGAKARPKKAQLRLRNFSIGKSSILDLVFLRRKDVSVGYFGNCHIHCLLQTPKN
ncbi:MAG: hypothetical protein AAF558_04335 [Verrucomicrobiota bacterium]